MQSQQHPKKNSLRKAMINLCLAVPLALAINTSVYAQSWRINLQDADIKAFITEVADITGKNFVLDPRVNGKVTVISNRALSKAEVYELFLGVMNVNGVVAVPSGTTIKLLPDNIAKQAGVAVDQSGRVSGETIVTRIIYLNNTSATELLPVIRPLMPQFANVAVVPSVNALVVSDRADSLNQVQALIGSLDGKGMDSLKIIPLQHADAKGMLELISSLTGTTAGSGQANTSNRLKILADSTNNRLLVKGSSEAQQQVAQLVAQLDTSPSNRFSGLRVFRLKYASATHVADMLRSLLANQSTNSAGATSTLEAPSMLGGSQNNSATTSQSSQNNTPTNNNSSVNATGQNNSQKMARPFSIIADQTQNALVVNASPELMHDIELAINELDARRDQVLIQAAILEISGGSADQLGVQWALGGVDNGVGVVNFKNSGVSVLELASAVVSKSTTSIGSAASKIAGALLGIGDTRISSNGQRQFYGAILQAIKNTSNANLLSMPSIITLDNEKASILVGQNVPFVTGQYTTTASSSSNPFQTIDRQDVGINLNVIPHIGAGGTVRLEVSQEVSSVVPESISTGASNIVTNKRMIQTTVLADDQQTIALGGLMQDDSTSTESKVPILGDIPGLGVLFRSRGSDTTKRNLLVFLQPTIIRDGQALATMTEARYNKLRMLQLEIDKNGNLNKLPLTPDRLYQQPAWSIVKDMPTQQPVIEYKKP